MAKIGLWGIASVAVLTMLYLVYMALTFEAPAGTTTVVITPPVQPLEAEPEAVEELQERTVLPQNIFREGTQTVAVAESEPEIAEPPEEVSLPEPEPEPIDAVDAAPQIELPSLNASDSFVFDSIRA
ncbi:MAG: hypothetical protein JJ934_19045 [Pseudomonadales bacterium]|nr:hypothetical protein [Pseudomonadales bacterium]